MILHSFLRGYVELDHVVVLRGFQRSQLVNGLPLSEDVGASNLVLVRASAEELTEVDVLDWCV